MAQEPFFAYENETDSLTIGGITVENRLDRISIYGELDLTKDQQGLSAALKLKRVVDAAVDTLKHTKNLPDQIEVKSAETIDNPFVQKA
jgi:hypothetical protein